MIRNAIFKFGLLVFLLGAASMASATGVPQTLQYQGRLTDGGGIPLTGVHVITLNIYNVASGGTSLITPITFSLTLVNGQFSVVLPVGSQLLPALESGATLYMGTTVDAASSELTPRQQITSVLTAFRAQKADTALFVPGAGVADGSVTGAKLGADAVTSAKVLDGTLVAADLAADAVTSAKVLDGTLVAADLAADAVTTVKIADGSVTGAKLGADAVTSAKVLDGSLIGADIQAGSVAPDRLQGVPGIAFKSLPPNVNIPGGNSPQVLDQLSINVPRIGYVVVEVSGVWETNNSQLYAWIGTTPTAAQNASLQFLIGATGDANPYGTFCSRLVVPVTPGLNTYYFIGLGSPAAGGIDQAQFTATFYSNSY